MSDPLNPRITRSAWWIAASYAVIATLWILYSDLALATLVTDPDRLVAISVYKGLAFVLVTSLLLVLLISRALRAYEKSTRARLAESTQRRAMEAELRAIIDSAMDAVIAVDHEDRVVHFNAAAEQMFGRPADAVVGTSLAALIPGFDRTHRGAFETFGARASGDAFPVSGTAADVDSVGAVRVVLALRDVTEERWSAALVVGQRQILESIAHGVPLAQSLDSITRFMESVSPGVLATILLLDDDGVHLRHGAAPSMPEEYTRAVDGSAIGALAGSCGTAAFTAQPVLVEDISTDERWAAYKHLALPHGLRACWSTPIVDADARVLGTFALYQGVPGRPTDRHRQLIEMATQLASVAIGRARVEHALRDSEARLAAVIEHLGEGLIVADDSGEVLHANPAAGRLLQLAPSDGGTYAQRTFYETFTLHDLEGRLLPVAEWPLSRIRRGERLESVEVIVRRRGEPWEKILAFSGSSVPYADDHQLLSMTLRDISARKRAERLLQETNESLEQKVIDRTAELRDALVRAESADRLKSAFLATMSHELRTPLNSIIGFTGIVLQGLAGPLTDEQQKQLGMVRGSARHLLDLINDVLDLSKIEAGQLEIRPETFELVEVVQRAAATVGVLAEKKGLTLTVELPAASVTMHGDRRRVEQVLLNLLQNAVKFTVRGHVTLTLSIHRDDRGDRVRIAVADTGIGIQAADLGSLFQPFRQLDSGLTRQHEGTGLGLTICRRLCDLMGGSISVTSTSGHGSTFTVDLPRSRSE